MKVVGVREFCEHASYYLTSKYALDICRNNRLIGVYIPSSKLPATEQPSDDLKRLGELLEQLARQNGLDEESFALLFESG